MSRLTIIILTLALTTVCYVSAKEYNASLFGIKSNGTTLNTSSIQKAIDFISENGGGSLVFYAGRYATGTIELKSNVTIRLEEGAVLVASHSVYNYFGFNGIRALIVAGNCQNIGITGKGVIEGRGAALRENISDQIRKGYMEGDVNQNRLALVHFSQCSNTVIDGIILSDACRDIVVLSGCNKITINNVTMENASSPDNKGVVLSNCVGVTVSNSYLNISGTEISSNGDSENVSVINTTNAKGKKPQRTK